jgi:glycine/D-amino acid oxidase-like deaminating enzyme
MPSPALNSDLELRSLWSATMPVLPDRSGGDLPREADVVVIGGGYAGINAARELARRGVAVTVIEARTLGWGASTRNGGIVHPGYKYGPRQLIKRNGQELGAALYQDTLDGYETVKRLIAEESIDCDFREVGYFELAWAGEHMIHLEQQQASLAAIGVESSMVPRERVHEEIGTKVYHG